MPEIYTMLASVTSYKDYLDASKRLLETGAFSTLEDEMVHADVSFSRSDYWGKDQVSRATRTPSSMDGAIAKLSKEQPDIRVLHVLQLMQAGMPVLSDSISRFLTRVTFR